MDVSGDVAPFILLGFKALRVPGLERLKMAAEQKRDRSKDVRNRSNCIACINTFS